MLLQLGHYVIIFVNSIKVVRAKVTNTCKNAEAIQARTDKTETKVRHLKEVLKKIETAQVVTEAAIKSDGEVAKAVAEAAQKKIEANLLEEKKKHQAT